jgi:hypothetical protein
LLIKYESHSLEPLFAERALDAIFISSLQVNAAMVSDFVPNILSGLLKKFAGRYISAFFDP